MHVSGPVSGLTDIIYKYSCFDSLSREHEEKLLHPELSVGLFAPFLLVFISVLPVILVNTLNLSSLGRSGFFFTAY